MSLVILPAFAVAMAWSWMREPQPSGDPATDFKARAVSMYFDRTWVNGDFPPTLWTHYDNLGPKTKNIAEGWRNGLNSSFGMPHPSLLVFLDRLQKYQFEVQCRGIQLTAGRPAKQRYSQYVKVEEDQSQLWFENEICG